MINLAANYSRVLPNCLIFEICIFYNFISAEDCFGKATKTFDTGQSVSNNLYGNADSLVPKKLDDNLKATDIPKSPKIVSFTFCRAKVIVVFP